MTAARTTCIARTTRTAAPTTTVSTATRLCAAFGSAAITLVLFAGVTTMADAPAVDVELAGVPAVAPLVAAS